MKATVIVRLKEQVPDAEGREIASRLKSEGYGDVDGIRIGRLVEIELSSGDRENAERRVEEICKGVLSNTYIEEFEILSIE